MMRKNHPMKKTAHHLGLILAVGASLCLPGPSSAEPENKTTDVFLLGGQSNMAGVGVFAEESAPYSEALPNVMIWDGSAWLSVPEYSKNLPTCGPEVSFAHAIARVLPGREIKLIKYALGGTALYNDWAPTGGEQYIEFMKTAEPALADLQAAGQKYRMAGMLWLQGESDAAENMGQDYEKNLRNFIDHMRVKFGTPDMPFIIARVRAIYGGATGHANLVRDAQDEVGHSMKNVICFDTDDCELLGNGAHYNTVGLNTIGNRFAESYEQILEKSTAAP